MPRHVSKPLTVRFVETVTKPGMYCDGGCLYLRVGGPHAKSWIIRIVVNGKRCDIGAGSADIVTLREAREEALETRRKVFRGEYQPKPTAKPDLTFYEASKRHFEVQQGRWTSGKHGQVWWSSLENHVFPAIGGKQLNSIQPKDLHEILQPIWINKYYTAKKVKQRIEGVFEWARAAGYYGRENPVAKLKAALPTPKLRPKHHPALDWRELPDFMLALSDRKQLSARLAEFTILTCVRSGEARGAAWAEISDGTWCIPADRMKSRRLHRVPLSKQCIHLLYGLPRHDAHLIFPSWMRGGRTEVREMSVNVFSALFKQMGVSGITMHGFRSTFKDWCTDNQAADWELSEVVLAHAVGSSVERAYARSDAFDRRVHLMAAWADFATSKIAKPKRTAVVSKPAGHASKPLKTRIKRVRKQTG